MRCPVCKPPQSLELDSLEDGLASRRCPSCNGHWIRTADFWKWRARRPNAPEIPAVEESTVPPEPVGLRICPDCDYVLARYRVGRGLGFTVDRCRNCEGAWLDGGEWEALRARNLHDDLPMIFDEAWQRAARREMQEQATEENFRRRLGDDDYERAQEIRAWLDPHPKRSELFAYLQMKHRRE